MAVTVVCLLLGLLLHSSHADNLEYQIVEELPVGTTFANVITDGNLARHYSQDALGKLRFSFLSGAATDPKNKLFGIREETGELFVKEVIDREQICPFLDVCDITLDVAVGPAQYFRQMTVNIEVMDVNDNAPKFAQESLHLYIPEISPTGTAYTIQAAIDQDIGIYGVQSYQLVPSVQYFSIETSTAIDGSPEVRLVVQQLLDREAISSFQFQLVASDGGNPPKSTSILVNITIGDDNDNVPVFTKDEYQVAIQEDTNVPTVIIQVQANDPDSGAGGIVSYAFSSKTFQLYGHMFQIDASSGDITLARKLDYESVNEYQLTVSAQDSAENTKAAFAQVIVRVLDVNDFEPVITINTLTDTEKAKVSEDSPVGTFVAHISVIDRDSGRFGRVTCTLKNTNKFTLEQLQQETQYKIVTSAKLDREIRDEYEVTIECRDQGERSLSSSQNLIITVLDSNDNAPRFDQEVYIATLQENNPVNAYIVRVNATDIDQGANGRVRYELMDPSTMFSLNPNSGVIRAIEALDFEQFHEVEFSVLAVDQGEPANTATAQVRVTLLDINDEAPKFTLATYTFVVMENMDSGSHVGRISATDADADPFNIIEYDFHVADISMNDIFRIDRETGSIYTRTKLDRESLSSYSFRVIAYNQGFTHMSSTASVLVYVDDQNDNRPRITFPNATDFTVHVVSNAGIGETVTQVKAYDADVGTSGRLSFMLTPHDAPFDIDTNTGVIILTEDASDLDQTIYDLTVHVTDHGTPPYNHSALIRVIANGTAPGSLNNFANSPLVSGPNMVIVIAVVAVSGVLMIMLLVAIAWVLYRNRRHDSDPPPKCPYTVEAQVQEPVKQTTDADLSNSTISAGFEDSIKRTDQRSSQHDFSRKAPCQRGQHSSDSSGFSDTFTGVPPAKHVTFALNTQKQDARTPHQETDGASTSSNEGSNTDSGCILPDDRQQHHQQQHQQHRQLQQQQQHNHVPASPPPLLPPRLRESPPPLLPPRELSPQFFPAPLHHQPRHLTVRDVKAKDKLKRGNGVGPQASDFAYNIPDVIQQNNFSDANSLLRYKDQARRNDLNSGTRKDRFSTSDNTSTTSGSYVIDPREVTECNV